MRLLYCRICDDVVRLHVSEEPRTCVCGRASGYMTTKRNVVIDGPGIILGIDDAKLERALLDRPREGRGSSFFAFVMPAQSHTVKREEYDHASATVQAGQQG